MSEQNEAVERIYSAIDEVYQKMKKLEAERLAKAFEENDFFVQNAGVKRELEKILPEGTQIYIAPQLNPSTILVIAKASLTIEGICKSLDNCLNAEGEEKVTENGEICN